jgi:APA family basic amino acid/polyamine antiporter
MLFAMNQTPQPIVATSQLRPVLGLVTATSLVIGEVIGSGIFIKPSEVARHTGGHVGLILALWIGCGLVNLCGALTMSELSAMLPRAGGNYVFLRETYGRLWGFLWGWAEFWVIRSGAIAALATALAISLEQALGYAGPEDYAKTTLFQKVTAVGVIAFLATINVIGTRWGGAVQVATTAVKAASLIFLGALPFWAAHEVPFQMGALWPGAGEWGQLTTIGAALAGIMWAYDGWGQVTVVAEEIHNPQRNVPLALIGGVLILVLLYTGANLGFHWTLPSAEIAAAPVPAAAVAERLLPNFGQKLVLAMLMVSAFGALNSNVLVGPRVLFAVARDHARIAVFRRIDPRTGTPALCIVTLSAWAMVLVAAADVTGHLEQRLFDVLTNYAIFGGSIFYLAAVVAVFVLRRRHPDWVRPYRTWGYPVVPGVFVVFYAFFLISMLWATPREALTGLSLIGLGIVAYFLFFARGEENDSTHRPGAA